MACWYKYMCSMMPTVFLHHFCTYFERHRLFFDPTDLSGTTEKFNLDLFSYIPYGVMKKKEVFFKCLQWCSNNRELIAQSKVIFRTLQKAFVIPFYSWNSIWANSTGTGRRARGEVEYTSNIDWQDIVSCTQKIGWWVVH